MRIKFKVLKMNQYCDMAYTPGFLVELNRVSSGQRTSRFAPKQITNFHDDEEIDFSSGSMYPHLEECPNPGFPPREKIRYCVRLSRQEKKEHKITHSEKWKPYWCYCFREKQWWKFKMVYYIFDQLYIPQIIQHHDFLKIKNLPFISKILNPLTRRDYEYFTFMESVGRTRRFNASATKKTLKELNLKKEELRKKKYRDQYIRNVNPQNKNCNENIH